MQRRKYEAGAGVFLKVLYLSQRSFRETPEVKWERGTFVKRKTVILSTTEHTLQATHGTR